MKPTCQRTSGDLRQTSILSSFAAEETWSLLISLLFICAPYTGGLTPHAWASALRMSPFACGLLVYRMKQRAKKIASKPFFNRTGRFLDAQCSRGVLM